MNLTENQIPNNWDELGQMINLIKSSSIDNLRFPDDDLFYENYLKYVDKKTRFKILFNTFEGKNRVILRPSFPYNNLLKKIPHISHYCLWNRSGKLSKTQIEQEIKNKFPQKKFYWFENDDIAKSILEIWHCHIFIKEK